MATWQTITSIYTPFKLEYVKQEILKLGIPLFFTYHDFIYLKHATLKMDFQEISITLYNSGAFNAQQFHP